MSDANGLVSVIVTTYNSPDFLEAVLVALDAQTHTRFEVLVADDGSTEATRLRIDEVKAELSYPLTHVWQEDDGFRVAAIRNKAAARAQGDYLIFLDGDCIPFPDFIERHLRFAEPGYFTAGNRILLRKEFTEEVTRMKLPIYTWGLRNWIKLRVSGGINRLLPLVALPDGPFRKWKLRQWKGVRSCNMACWRGDFLAVNGYDERYQGWGREDSDFAIRMINAGIFRKDVRYGIPVLHLWHPENDRAELEKNDRRLNRVINEGLVRAEIGVSRHLSGC